MWCNIQQSESLDYNSDSRWDCFRSYNQFKLWNTSNGFCFVTFSEHSSTITGLEFATNGQFIVSSSLDGTARAYDLLRFDRTVTSISFYNYIYLKISKFSHLHITNSSSIFLCSIRCCFWSCMCRWFWYI